MLGKKGKKFFLQQYFGIFASVRVTKTSKAVQTTAIGTVANSLSKKTGNSFGPSEIYHPENQEIISAVS